MQGEKSQSKCQAVFPSRVPSCLQRTLHTDMTGDAFSKAVKNVEYADRLTDLAE